MRTILRALIGTIVCAGACVAQTGYPLVGEPTSLAEGEVRVTAAEDWAGSVEVPQAAADQRIVLHMDARLDSGPGGGGCNWVLQVRLNDRLLDEAVRSPRLINKPPDFDLLGTDFHFDWYARHHQAWMTLFCGDWQLDMTDAEDDFGFLWDVTQLVEPGEPLQVRLVYAQKNLPNVMGKDAPVFVRDAWLGVMGAADVARMRAQAIAGGQARTPVPIVAELPADAPAGERPYEVEWSGREETPPAQVSFEDLSGWTASLRGEAEMSLKASREHRIWREQGLRVTMQGGATNATLEIRPPQPIPVEGEWDAIDLWAKTNLAGGLHPTRPVLPVVIVEDARGVEHEIELSQLMGRYWYVSHAKLSAEQTERIAYPAKFAALLLDRVNQAEEAMLLLESIAFYPEHRDPYAVDPRPAQASFPTGEDAMLPTPPEGAVSEARPDSIQEFMCRTDEWVEFWFPPTAAKRDPFSVAMKFDRGDPPEEIVLDPLRGGGILFDTPAGPVLTSEDNTELIGESSEGEVLQTRWRFSAEGVEAEFTVDYRIRGATLVLDVRCAGGAAMGTRFGVVGGLENATEIPYLQMGTPPGPLVAYNDHVFVSALYDWPNCDFSISLVNPDMNAQGGVAINEGSVYNALTDGKRRDLHDRIIVTVAPEFEQVLPNVPNPRAKNLDAAAERMFVMSSGPSPILWSTMERYGLEHVIAMHFAGVWWRGAGEGFSMRHRPRPEMTIEELAAYRDEVKALGYDFGVLLEYRDFFPLNEWWDPNLLSLTPEGDWSTSWSGHYASKPNATPMLAARNAALIEARYPLDAVYMDTHTNQPLTARDYEAGVPGAGSGPTQALFNGECILSVRDSHEAIICSEGIYRWLYAGLAEMDYATWPIRSILPSKRDILPDFDLHKIHPKNIGTGMGYNPAAFFGRDSEAMAPFYGDPGERLAPDAYYQYLAATIAHGHSPILGYSYFPPMHRMIHYYAMQQGPAKEWLTDTVARIERHDGEGFVSTSEAIRGDALGTGRIRITYERGMTVCVNYHREEPWTVEIAGRSYELPPMGWVARARAVKGDEIESFSALIDGKRVDYCRCPEYTYLSSPEGESSYGGITVDGAVYVLRDGEALRVIPCGQLGRWRSGIGRFGYDREIIEVPADRGTPTLRIDLREVAPALARTVEGGVLSIAPDAETVEYAVGP